MDGSKEIPTKKANPAKAGDAKLKGLRVLPMAASHRYNREQ